MSARDTLLALVRLGSKRDLVFVEGPGLRAEEGLSGLRAHLPPQRQTWWHRLDRDGALDASLSSVAPGAIVLVHGLEFLPGWQRQRGEEALNAARERICRHEVLILLWVPTEQREEFESRCPDLLAFRSAFLSLTEAEVPVAPAVLWRRAYLAEALRCVDLRWRMVLHRYDEEPPLLNEPPLFEQLPDLRVREVGLEGPSLTLWTFLSKAFVSARASVVLRVNSAVADLYFAEVTRRLLRCALWNGGPLPLPVLASDLDASLDPHGMRRSRPPSWREQGAEGLARLAAMALGTDAFGEVCSQRKGQPIFWPEEQPAFLLLDCDQGMRDEGKKRCLDLLTALTLKGRRLPLLLFALPEDDVSELACVANVCPMNGYQLRQLLAGVPREMLRDHTIVLNFLTLSTDSRDDDLSFAGNSVIIAALKDEPLDVPMLQLLERAMASTSRFLDLFDHSSTLRIEDEGAEMMFLRQLLADPNHPQLAEKIERAIDDDDKDFMAVALFLAQTFGNAPQRLWQRLWPSTEEEALADAAALRRMALALTTAAYALRPEEEILSYRARAESTLARTSAVLAERRVLWRALDLLPLPGPTQSQCPILADEVRSERSFLTPPD